MQAARSRYCTSRSGAGAPTEMNAGDVATFPVGVNEQFVVRTQDPEHPIYMAAYMQGYRGGYYGTPDMAGNGDPEFVNVVPAGQWRDSYSFYADPTYDDTSSRRDPRQAAGQVRRCLARVRRYPRGLDPDRRARRVRVRARRSAARRRARPGVRQQGLPDGSSADEERRSLHRHDLGLAFAASYAYPGGMALRKLVDTPLLPIQ